MFKNRIFIFLYLKQMYIFVFNKYKKIKILFLNISLKKIKKIYRFNIYQYYNNIKHIFIFYEIIFFVGNNK